MNKYLHDGVWIQNTNKADFSLINLLMRSFHQLPLLLAASVPTICSTRCFKQRLISPTQNGTSLPLWLGRPRCRSPVPPPPEGALMEAAGSRNRCGKIPSSWKQQPAVEFYNAVAMGGRRQRCYTFRGTFNNLVLELSGPKCRPHHCTTSRRCSLPSATLWDTWRLNVWQNLIVCRAELPSVPFWLDALCACFPETLLFCDNVGGNLNLLLHFPRLQLIWPFCSDLWQQPGFVALRTVAYLPFKL